MRARRAPEEAPRRARARPPRSAHRPRAPRRAHLTTRAASRPELTPRTSRAGSAVTRVVRALPILLLAAVLVACGGVGRQHAGDQNRTALTGYGIGIDLPSGWHGRIVLGSGRLPVLHAADHPLPAGDADWGDLEQEEGIPGVYLNVQEL